MDIKKIIVALTKDKWLLTSTTISMLGIIVALLLSTNFLFKTKIDDNLNKDLEDLFQKIIILDQTLKNKDERIKQLEDSISLYNHSNKTTKVHSDFESIKAELHNLKQDLKKVDEIVIENPEKALSLPLLRRDIQSLKDEVGKNSLNQKEEIARVYDMNKWIIGLVFSMIVSIVILNISSINKAKKE